MTGQIDSWHGDTGAPGSDGESGFDGWVPTDVRGKLIRNAPLDKLVWFKTGGPADWLFEPADLDDLVAFLAALDEGTPVMALGLGSNLIVRDGGVPGVVVRLGKPFATVEVRRDCVLECGGGASGILVASAARDAGIAGLEFLRGIPGTVGGFVRMNGGAYGREVADVLVDCDLAMPDGSVITVPATDLRYTYRHSELPEGRRDGPHRLRARGVAAVAEQDRRLDLQEPARRQGLAAGRCGGLPRARAGRCTGQRKACQLPDKHRQCHEHRHRGAGRGSSPPRVRKPGRGARMGNPEGRTSMRIAG
jgi:hypothetical protein